jgi:hypothetical protein
VKLIRSLKVGDKVRLTLYREKKTEKVEFSLPERPILPSDLHLSGSSALLPMKQRINRFPLHGLKNLQF